MKKYLLIWLVILLQLLVLWWIIYKYQSVLNYWKQVFVKIQPVDPRDIFRWDYVVLNYDISQFSWDTNITWDHNKSVYVVPTLSWDTIIWISKILENPSNDFFIKSKLWYINTETNMKIRILSSSWEIIKTYNSYYQDNYKVGDKLKVYFYGSWVEEISYIEDANSIENDYYKKNYTLFTWEIVDLNQIKTINLQYSADRFFVKEWTGKEIEQNLRDGDSYASWKVWENWEIVVDWIVINGKFIK